MSNKFTLNQKSNWRSVPLWATVRVANACHRGSDYARCSKSSIYENFESGRSNGRGTPDRETFVKIMNQVAIVCRQADAKLRSDVGGLVHSNAESIHPDK